MEEIKIWTRTKRKIKMTTGHTRVNLSVSSVHDLQIHLMRSSCSRSLHKPKTHHHTAPTRTSSHVKTNSPRKDSSQTHTEQQTDTKHHVLMKVGPAISASEQRQLNRLKKCSTVTKHANAETNSKRTEQRQRREMSVLPSLNRQSLCVCYDFGLR